MPARRMSQGSSGPRSSTAATLADRMPLPALVQTLADLGIDLHSQRNVHLDLDQRPGKSPRAFCSPIEVPDKVMLVIQPIGGHDDWRALFHEAGQPPSTTRTLRPT